MHPEVDNFVKAVRRKYPQNFETVKVLEVGSQNINGSVRSNFRYCDYTGIDLGEAPGVDKVLDIGDLKEVEVYDTVISCEMLEHCKEWEKALVNMYIALKRGGLLILTCAGPKRHEHGTKNHTPQDSKFTLDWYRNISKEDFTSVLPSEMFNLFYIAEVRGDTDLNVFGVKK